MERRLTPTARRFVLGAALAAALVAWLAPHPPVVRATTPTANAVAVAQNDATPAPPDVPKGEAPAAPGAETAVPAARPRAEVTIDERGVTVRGKDKRVVVGGFGDDHEYESFDDMVRQAPWLAALVFLVVTLVFLGPALVIGLIVWYKLRKTRMLNETMIRLAERGVMPPGEAIEAIASGSAAAAGPVSPAAAPVYEHVRRMRRHAAWSDLRKGVIMLSIGLGIVAYSVSSGHAPNGFGLVLFFVGIGFCVLWYLEDRATGPRGGEPDAARSAPPAGGA
jgi:hypothetical protein